MKKLLLIGLTLLTLFTLSACSKNDTASDDLEKITVVATLEPHATILDACKPLLKEKGYDLDVVVVDDYYIPNRSVNDGEADANYFQHIPFFEAEVKNNGYKLVNVAGVHIEPFGFYSNEIKSINELKDGSTIVISNSVADHGRILNILAANNLIEIKDGVNAVDATINDIAKNPKNLKFVEVKPELLTLALANNEGSLVAINGNYAIGYGLNPTKDAIILEKGDSSNPYVNILAAREDNAESDKIKALVEVLKSDEIKNFILEHYSDGSVIPAE